MTWLRLVASSDDYLLEERLRDAVCEACSQLGSVEPEFLPSEITPEELAVELHSPSLFSPQRILVLQDAIAWIDAPPGGAAGARSGRKAPVDVGPVVRVLEEGLGEDVALILGAWVGRPPKGPLVEAIAATGSVDWIPLPEPPKPWQDVVLSEAQVNVLREVMARAVPGIAFEADAERMLFERLGFAPRLLVQEARKLAAASGGKKIDVALVRALAFPLERSLEVVREAILGRQLTPILDIVAAAERGTPIRDWRGQIVDVRGVPTILVSQLSSLMIQLLFLRRVARGLGLADELDPERAEDPNWYPRRFKNDLGPKMSSALDDERPSPLHRARAKKPTPWALGQLFAGASRYSDDELVRAVADLGPLEVAIRGDLALTALSSWITRTLQR